MIKLIKGLKPKYLTTKKELELISKFKADGSSVWNVTSIKKPLIKSSNDKCAYCECGISEESKYMEVDHFKHKDAYPDLVVDWDNLIPSCKRCNRNKWDHDVINEPIINPYIQKPSDHLYVYNMRVLGKDDIGKKTEKVLLLNDSFRVVRARAELVFHLDERISDILENICDHERTNDIEKLKKALTQVHGVLSECQPEKQYSYVTSATTINNKQFQEVVSKIKGLGLWDAELSSLYDRCAGLH